jgi:type VI secretion system protein ImpI/type VI secretion system protein
MMTRPLKVDAPKASSVIENAPNPNLSRSQSIGGVSIGPQSIAPQSAPAPSLALYEGDFDVGLSAFCRGAGIDPRNVGTDARGAALQLAGQLLREAVLGLMDLNQGRGEFRNKFRISASAADASESPLNLSKGVDEALVRLLTNLSTRAGSVDAIRENFRELKAQNTATVTAMRAAFEEFLTRVNPKDLEERFERSSKRGVFGGQSKAKYWDLYAELFGGLAQRPADGFPHLFMETFAKAYEARLRALIPPRRSSFGGDRDETDNPGGHAVGDH